MITNTAIKQVPSKNSDLWQTPKPLFNLLQSIFSFEVDGAASEENALLPNFHTVETSMEQRLEDYANKRVFINPPFSELSSGKWFEPLEQIDPKLVLFLIPARIETKVWHKYIWPNSTVFAIRGRLSYVHPELGTSKGSPAFASVFSIFGDLSQYDVSPLKQLGFFLEAV